MPSLHDFDPALPDALDAVLERALAKEADDRYANALDMAAELERAAQTI